MIIYLISIYFNYKDYFHEILLRASLNCRYKIYVDSMGVALCRVIFGGIDRLLSLYLGVKLNFYLVLELMDYSTSPGSV